MINLLFRVLLLIFFEVILTFVIIFNSGLYNIKVFA